jgi:hypothetical protein
MARRRLPTVVTPSPSMSRGLPGLHGLDPNLSVTLAAAFFERLFSYADDAAVP